MIEDRLPRTLTLALFLRVSFLIGIMICVLGALTYSSAREQVNRLYDGQLITGANVLRSLMTDEISERRIGNPNLSVDDVPLLSAEDRRAFNDYADWRMFRIWHDGKLVLASDTGPVVPAPADAHTGFSSIGPAGDRWRVYTIIAHPGIIAQVGERKRIRGTLIARVAIGLSIPLLLTLPASLAMVWLALSDGLGALRLLVGQIARRTPRDLEPLSLGDWPTDFAPLIRAINALFGRVARTFEQERRFVEHAAHQIRTPLAALRLQTQLIARENDSAERAAQAEHLTAIVDRTSALLEQLLTLARLDSDMHGAGVSDLHAIIVSVLEDCAPAAAARGVSFVLDGSAGRVNGAPTSVRLVAANLLENALKHAPDGSEIKTILSTADEKVVLSIIDGGPGIPPSDRAKVFERFYQSTANQSKGNGSGLGLAIAQQAARTINAQITLCDREDNASGLCVKVEFLVAPQKSPIA